MELRRWLPLTLAAGLLIGVGGPTGSALADDPKAGTGTVYGATVQLEPGEQWAAGITRLERLEGRLGVVRIFQNEPLPSILAPIGGRDGIVSFRLTPDQVLSGRYDGAFRAFFRAAPTGHPTWWSYYHEADVAYTHGKLGNLARFRQAATHVALLARAARNPQLRDAVILVDYTANPRSGLTVSQFMPRADLVDVIAWDDYNGSFTQQGSYGDPTRMIQLNRAASAKVGKPFAIAEFGSIVVHGNTAGRAAWITRFSRVADAEGARFVSYYDSNQYGKGPDFRLLDRPSQAAYRAVVSDQNPF